MAELDAPLDGQPWPSDPEKQADFRVVSAQERVRAAVGSYVPHGRELGHWVTATAQGTTAFYDIDTPITLSALDAGTCDHLDKDLVGAYDIYLSFTGGPTLQRLADLGARRPVPFWCLVDPVAYPVLDLPRHWDLGYLGTWSADRQPALERLLLEPARQRPTLHFVVAGSQYPPELDWPSNVQRVQHLPPAEHPAFYAAQGLTLNITRTDMIRAGWSPSVRLFEAAACATPVVSDDWPGLDSFFTPGTELLLAESTADVLRHIDALTDQRRSEIGQAAKKRVHAEHTATHRVEQLLKLLTT